jgi:hypothetical protein
VTTAATDPSIFSVAIPALSGLIGAAIGVFATHRFATTRDREQKRREFALKYLIEAWQCLEEGSRPGLDVGRQAKILEKAVVDIQLFGSAEQIKLARQWTNEMVSKNNSQTTPLLRDFQQQIRRELGLQRSPEELFFFRLTPIGKKMGESGL